jgi:hypothetical protein
MRQIATDMPIWAVSGQTASTAIKYFHSPGGWPHLYKLASIRHYNIDLRCFFIGIASEIEAACLAFFAVLSFKA